MANRHPPKASVTQTPLEYEWRRLWPPDVSYLFALKMSVFHRQRLTFLSAVVHSVSSGVADSVMSHFFNFLARC